MLHGQFFFRTTLHTTCYYVLNHDIFIISFKPLAMKTGPYHPKQLAYNNSNQLKLTAKTNSIISVTEKQKGEFKIKSEKRGGGLQKENNKTVPKNS